MGSMKNFAENLQRLRHENKLSRKTVAKAIGVDVATIGYYERAERIPNIEVFTKIADLFNKTADELLGRFVYSSDDYYDPAAVAKRFWEGLGIHIHPQHDGSIFLILPATLQTPVQDNNGRIIFPKIVNDVKAVFGNIGALFVFTNMVKEKIFDATLSKSKEIAVNEIKNLYAQLNEQKDISA